MLPDFALLAPEINSARMYAGPRSGSMWAAAAAWDGLSAQLGSAASSVQSTVSTLTGVAWVGVAAMSMVTAAEPYVNWLTSASAQAEQVANQARLSAAAFDAAFAATVPPQAVAANRAQLMALIATNFLGQNTPAIAATEALYAEMWAQDATAMTCYDASTRAAEAQWTPFARPPTSLAGPTPSAAPTVQQMLSQLTQSPLFSSLSTAASRLEMLSMPAEMAMEPMDMLMSQAMTGANPLMSGAAGAVPAMDSAVLPAVGPGVGGAGMAPLSAPLAPLISAGAGQAGSVGPLSVPASWANAVSAATPAQAVAGTAGAPSAGVSQVSASMPRLPSLPSMNTPGRGMAGAAPAVDAPREGVVPHTVLG